MEIKVEMKIRIIAAGDTYSIRHEVLRPSQTLADCRYPLDHYPETIHTGAFLAGQLVSIASFFYEKCDEFSEPSQYRLRGMATLPAYRNQKARSSQILFAEEIMKSNKADIWWCNARTTVSEYYEKMGLKIIGNVFEIEPIGPHVRMYKYLNSEY